VRKIPSKSYAFVEFENFTSAEAVCKQSVHTPYVLGGAVLTVRWGKSLDEVESGMIILFYLSEISCINLFFLIFTTLEHVIFYSFVVPLLSHHFPLIFLSFSP
jgi:RNA recognition motif-containing protein